MNLSYRNEAKPWLFVYSMILPAVWLTIGTIGNIIAPGRRVGITGTALMFLGVITLISWIFVRKYRRHFTGRESFRITCYCVGWAILIETCGLIYAASIGLWDPSKTGVVAFVVSVTVIIDTLFLWAGFTFSSRRFINWYLEKYR